MFTPQIDMSQEEKPNLCICGCKKPLGAKNTKYATRRCKDRVRNRQRYERQKLIVADLPVLKRLIENLESTLNPKGKINV